MEKCNIVKSKLKNEKLVIRVLIRELIEIKVHLTS